MTDLYGYLGSSGREENDCLILFWKFSWQIFTDTLVVVGGKKMTAKFYSDNSDNRSLRTIRHVWEGIINMHIKLVQLELM
jgi:hypothetical protein